MIHRLALALLTILLAGCSAAPRVTREKSVLFQDDFSNLNNWHLEGQTAAITIPSTGTLRLDCQSKMGFVGAMAFCRRDFPDNIAIEYDLIVENHNGLLITFVAMTGLNGEDALTTAPPRTGIFEDYYNGTRSYHTSICRYEDDGTHTGVSNWRRNPGLHLMTSGPDLCRQTQKRYHVKVAKSGPRCAVEVDGQPGANFTDPQTLPSPIPTTGKLGVRAIGGHAIFKVSNVKVLAISPLPVCRERVG